MNKIIELIKENRLFVALLIYHTLISARIFIEMEHLTLFIFIHQLFWFTGVMIWFFVVFKYVLKINIKKLWFFSGGGALTYIPLIYSSLKGERWSLNYVAPESFFQVVRDMATFLFNHPRNWPMFPELVVLFAFTLSVSICLSKNIPKSLLATILAVYGSFFIFGFSWISVDLNHPSLLPLSSTYDPQKFYALQMLSICSVLLIVIAKDAAAAVIKREKILISQIVMVFLISYIATIFVAYVITGSRTPSVADCLIIIPTVFLFSSSLFFAVKSKSLKAYIIPFYFSIFLLITLFYNINPG
jgi:hypothetical protein